MKIFAFAILSLTSVVCFAKETPKVQIWAHQGESRLEIPNSPMAVKRAFELGSKYVEFDVSITNSGEMICVHGAHELKSHWGITKKLKDITREDIEKSKIKLKHFSKKYPNAKLPTLEQIFAVVPPDGILVVDVKRFNEEFVKKFDTLLQKAGLKRSQIIIANRSVELAKMFKKISPEYNKFRTSYFFGEKWKNNASAEEVIKHTTRGEKDIFYTIGIGQAGLEKKYLKFLSQDKDYFRKIKSAGYVPCAWTTDNPELAKKLIHEYGVEIVFSNKASFLREKLGLPKER